MKLTSGLEEWEIERYVEEKWQFSHSCNGWKIPILLSILYLSMVFFGKRLMSNTSQFSLRPALFVWSTLLAAFSIIGTYRSFLVFHLVYSQGGFQNIICSVSYYTDPVSRFWIPLFAWSKFFEYIDTAFIILRKQELIFLHWYHHVTVSLFSWLMMMNFFSGGIIFMCMNFFVHSFMYTYYAVRAAGFKPPRFISVVITSLQIIQMFIGCFTIGLLWSHSETGKCTTSAVQITSGSLMYFSYLLLFAHFFYKSYLKPVPKKTEVKSKKKVSKTNTTANGKQTNLPIKGTKSALSNASSNTRRRRN